MKELLPLTQLLFSCWIIGDEGADATMPTSGGILEHALKEATQQGLFPEWARNQLHFVVSETGLSCLELPYVQKLATELKLTSDPNPSYTRTEIVVGKPVALRCLSRLGIEEELAREWGRALRGFARKAEQGKNAAQA